MARNYYPAQHEVYRYFLRYQGQQYAIEVPDNWKQAKKEFARSKFFHGMMITLSDVVIFSGGAYTFISQWVYEDGVIANIDILEYEKDNITDEFTLIFQGELDLSDYKESDHTISVKINSDTLTKKIQSRYQTEITLDNETNLDGMLHGQGLTPTISVFMRDRLIQGESLLDIGTAYTSTFTRISELQRSYNIAILFTNRQEGFFGDLPVTFSISSEFQTLDNAGGTETPFDTSTYFFFNKQQDEIANGVTIDLSFDISIDSTGLPSSFVSRVYLISRLLENSEEFGEWTYVTNSVRSDLLLEEAINPNKITNLTYKNSFGLPDLETNRIYKIIVQLEEMQDGVDEVIINFNSASLNIYGGVKGGGTTNDVILPKDAFDRMVMMMGGSKLTSKYLSDSRLSILNGYMLRNVPEYRDTLVYTFEKLFHSYDSINPIGLAVEGQTVIIEERNYFYQNFIAYDFGEDVYDVKYEFDKEQSYSEINVGFETSNFSSEAAKKEFNVKSVWVSPINIYKVEANFVSNIQASPNVMETSRRVQYQEDVERSFSRRGDTTMFFLDLADNENRPREPYEDFEGVATNIPFPEDQFNMRLSPMNRLKNISQWITMGYQDFRERQLTFSSSTGATDMATKPIGGTLNAEEDNFTISDLKAPIYIGKKVTFGIPNINFGQVINEQENDIKKMYGLFRFQQGSRIVTGFLLSYKVDSNEVELQIKKIDIVADVVPPEDKEPPIIGTLYVELPLETPTGINLEQIS